MPSWNRKGFTLIELLIAAVLAGIFAIVLFSFVSGQARFTQVQSARQEVQQNTRGAIELMMSELRAVPGGGIEVASATELRFRVPRIWGMLCDSVVNGAVTMVLPPEQAEGNIFPADFVTDGSVPWGIALRDTTVANSAAFSTATVTDTAGSNGSVCTANMGTVFNGTNPPRPLVVQMSALPARDGVPYKGGEGGMAYLYQVVTYDVGSSSVAPGTWLRRSLAADGSSPQPVAGPLAEADADPVSFTYLCGNAPIDGTIAANRPFITAVRLATAMQSSPSTRAVLQVERDTVTVHLRNSGQVICP